MDENKLQHLCWSFSGSKYNDIKSFISEFIEYQSEVCGEDLTQEVLDELVILEPIIRVKYWCYNGDQRIEPIITLKAQNELAFTAIDLMFQLHNSIVDQLEDIDHHFFEGVRLSHNQDVTQPTLYQLCQGS